MKKIINIIIGSLLIAVSFDVFFLSYEIVPNGIFGMAALLNYINGYDPALFVLIVNFSPGSSRKQVPWWSFPRSSW